jgi:hypothetical protein
MSEQALRAGDALDTGIALAGDVERLGQTFEHAFDQVMDFARVEHLDMEGQSGVLCQAAKEFFRELGREISRAQADHFDILRDTKDDERSATEIERDAHERFVHRQVKESVAANAFLVAEGLGERLTEGNAGIFDGVMKIDFDVALDFEVEIEKSVLGQQGQHVVEKRDAGLDVGFAGTVDIELEGNVGLTGLADNGSRAFHREVLDEITRPEERKKLSEGSYGCAGAELSFEDK